MARTLAVGLLGAILAAPVRGAPAATFLEPDAAVGRVLELVNARLALMPGVAAAKWRRGLPIADPPREQQVIERAVAAARALGLASEGVGALFALQIRLAREREEQLTARWDRLGFEPAAPTPDLERELRPKLDALTAELLEALYLARPSLEPGNLATRFPGLAERVLTEAGWSERARGALLEALAAVKQAPVPPLARIAASGVLRIGTTGDYAPYSIESQGRLEGADIELAMALASGLGVRAVFVRTSWSQLLDDLAADRFDLAVGGISDTPARRAAGSFSTVYATGGKTIIGRCRDAARYSSLAAIDRPEVRVIVNPGGTNQQFVRERLRHARVIVYPDNRGVFEELRAGRADVMITDDVEVELQTRRHPDLCRALPGTLTHADKAVLLPRDAAFEARIDALLAPEIAAGAPARRVAEFIAHAAVDPASAAP